MRIHHRQKPRPPGHVTHTECFHDEADATQIRRRGTVEALCTHGDTMYHTGWSSDVLKRPYLQRLDILLCFYCNTASAVECVAGMPVRSLEFAANAFQEEQDRDWML